MIEEHALSSIYSDLIKSVNIHECLNLDTTRALF